MKNKYCFSAAVLLLLASFMIFSAPLMADVPPPDIVAEMHDTVMPDLIDNDVADIYAASVSESSNSEYAENTESTAPVTFTVIWNQSVEFPHGRAEHGIQNMVLTVKNSHLPDAKLPEVGQRHSDT